MKRIGFIDYYLDEWHANKYPEWIRQASGGAMEVAYAWAKTDAPNGRTNEAWSRDHGIELLSSIEKVVEQSDYLIVLSPDHPQFHEELAELPLRSGKPTYVDKTFAPDRAAALRLFELADKHGTPLFSSSALRFASEYAALEKADINAIHSIGPGAFANYSIHQIEPIVSLLGCEAERIMYTGTDKTPSWLIRFSGERQAAIHHFGGAPFSLALHYTSGKYAACKAESNFFAAFIGQLIPFFESGKSPVDPAETVAIMSIIEHGFQASASPFQWIELPRGM
ncbi:MAG: NAD(P)-binding protein [Paenibacillus sp.]|jgi:hypothetical protein|nr:NAD(P)-binding protein [Paenibacillus sp.]